MSLYLLWRTLSLGKSTGLEVDDDEMEELVDELPDLQREQQQMAAKELSSEEGREDIPISLIKEKLRKWGENAKFY